MLLRYGGEEFVFAVLGLPDTVVRGVIARIEADLAAHDLVTVTCGLAFVTAFSSLPEVLVEADADLYRQRCIARTQPT